MYVLGRRFALPGSTAAAWLVGASVPHRRNIEAQVASREALAAYAADQAGGLAAGRNPRRTAEIEERYQRYFRWLGARGQRGWEYLAVTGQWRGEYCGPWVALEPNIVPYELEPGVEHWNLWYHPSTTPGGADLDLQVGAAVELLEGSVPGHILAVRRLTYEAPEEYDVAAAPSGAVVTVGRAALRPSQARSGRWAAVLRHVRLFLPGLDEDEVLIFQNIPEVRSVPQMAHAHVFFFPKSPGTRAALRRLSEQWRLRSPWTEEERLTGRGGEVGWPAQ